MKFLLINPSVDRGAFGSQIAAVKAHSPTLGMLYIASAIEDEGLKVEALDFEAEIYENSKIEKKLTNVDFIGFHSTIYNIAHTKKISNFIKETAPDIPIISGGPLCCIEPEQSLIDTNANAVVQGEGEKIIGRIINAIQGKEKFKKIPGVYYKENKKIKKGPPAELIEDLDSLSFPARHLVDKYDYGYSAGTKLYKGKHTSIISSRGCPYNCRFCSVNAITKKYRIRSVDDIIKELDEINNKYDFLLFADDNFLVNKKWSEEVLDRMIQNKYSFKLGFLGIRIDAVEKEILKKMKKAGTYAVTVGVESGSQEILNFYNKKTTLDQIRNAVKLSSKMGFFTYGNFIMGAPIETEAHLKETLNFAKSLPFTLLGFYPFQYLKGSDLWEEAYKEGKIKDEEYVVKTDPSRGLGNFTFNELEKWSMNSVKSYVMRPKFLIPEFFRSLLRKDTLLLKEAINLAKNKLKKQYLPKHFK